MKYELSLTLPKRKKPGPKVIDFKSDDVMGQVAELKEGLPPSHSTQRMGDAWAAENLSAVLRVPSGLIPGKRDYLINPAHRNFSKLKIGAPEPFEFDPRLLK